MQLPARIPATSSGFGNATVGKLPSGSDVVALAVNTEGSVLWQKKFSSGSWDKRDGESTGANPSVAKPTPSNSGINASVGASPNHFTRRPVRNS